MNTLTLTAHPHLPLLLPLLPPLLPPRPSLFLFFLIVILLLLSQGTHPSIASSSVFSPFPSLSVESQGSATPLIMCRSPTDVKSKMSPRSNLKFRFDKMSHSTTSE
ncbi:unnamed protein product [Oncorhynchus mykiss]|uniref:Uncharacterized protein n=1 Tax=Oncorhynchus mykiss TaxID=8022 RepID=A0A060XRG0_ONCMY|nr:unnamed protein product [Oncorhynchus mykiss]